MTMNQVMIELRRSGREAVRPEELAKWCGEVDGWVDRKVWRGRTPPSGEKRELPYLYPEDGDRDLLVPEPWDRLYLYYACAMVDLRRREYADYNNEMALYNSLHSDYARYVNRTRPPVEAVQVRGL